MKRIAIVAAMPGELKPLVRGWQHERCDGIDLWTRKDGDQLCIAACAGAGQQAATRAFAAIEQSGPLAAAISIGWVGALAEQFEPGCSYRISGVIDQQTGERFSAAGVQEDLWLVTSPRVADEGEKLRLAAAYSAGFVDMEAAAVARLAAMRGIPFNAIKGVSDGFRDKLLDFNRFLGAKGEFQLARLILFVVPRPWLWSALIRMGENSRKASQAIAKDLSGLLDELE
ncbi:MAG: nucleoside phosphorylase [Terracidiphilus sp.]|nr:nucleoside phosphorylase [Terracidiphilus sp.]